MLENFVPDQSTLNKDYYGDYSVTNTNDEIYEITHTFFTSTKPLKNTDIGEKKKGVGPKLEIHEN